VHSIENLIGSETSASGGGRGSMHGFLLFVVRRKEAVLDTIVRPTPCGRQDSDGTNLSIDRLVRRELLGVPPVRC
jgi:hypothetical protein